MKFDELFYNIWYEDHKFFLERKSKSLKEISNSNNVELWWASINPPVIGVIYKNK